ncbi:PilW family protein [Corallincola platygyrae]|uniref:PilW family protein n=1 Tax=Corallincola platygyrae TaxID=1193278 RepID=A0ABW4XRX4_9GAMM
MTNSHIKEKGFSLVELMVTMVLGLVLLGGVVTFFTSQSRLETQTTAVGELQENARLALNILSQDVAQAGYFGDFTGINLNSPSPTVELNVGVNVPTTECQQAGGRNGTFPVGDGLKFRTIWAGFSVNGAPLLTAECDSPNAGTDVLQIKRFIVDPLDAGDESAGRFYGMANFSQIVLYQAGAAPTAADVQNGARYEYQHHVYYIASSPSDDPTVPYLQRRQLIIENGNANMELASGGLVPGIENIHFQFGIDTNGDGHPNGFLDTPDVTANQWDSADAIGERIVAVRIFVLARAREPDASYQHGEIVYQMGGRNVTIPSADKYRRMLLSTTVTLRNPL